MKLENAFKLAIFIWVITAIITITLLLNIEKKFATLLLFFLMFLFPASAGAFVGLLRRKE